MELSYDKEKKWRVVCGDGTTKKLKSTWEPQTQYQVAIVLRNGTQGTVYVDGQRVCEGVQRKLENTGPKEISHFYIGGGEDSTNNKRSQEGVPVTVRNVLLYNRPWTLPGKSAEVEEDIPPPSEDTVTGDTNAASLANQNSEAPVVQAAPQKSPQTSETQQITTAGGSATTQQVPAASKSHAGEVHGDGGTYCGSRLLPLLLLLLGLWGFAAL
ncbi:trans-sialidase, putative [Trypanosoma cruzi marinkellei]|uniref:Trans-sialidase, putative n=1 Tax=Trypanosoma cruzi marinkellei TaxID=85056 RepID=K2MPT0_TRYCR|nr:trans-sialidase, putative [Trypanosoma cruzi marinkellei]